MKSPCMDCPYRKLICHDRCEPYQEYHEELVAARKALKKADDAISVLIEGARKSKRRSNTR